MTTKIQTILLSEKNNYLKKYHLNAYELKCYNYMAACGTETFGYNAFECEDCGYKLIHYNSCGNRHCPSCQAKSREEWISKMQSFLLDIPYFHIVFTVPDSLNDIFLWNKQLMYSLLLKVSSQSLLQAAESKYGQIGLTSLLHTWGSNLWIHPHVHMIVSGGGLTRDNEGNEIFKHSPKNFFLPVKALSRLFRGKFMDEMIHLDLHDSYGNQIDFSVEPYQSLISQLYHKEWVVYSKETFGNNQAVLNYIGRYSHRVAISNSRILNYDHSSHTVTFRYKDYKDEGKQKEMTLNAIEFIHRFMMHILPPRFIKIRHYGFMSNSNRKKLLPKCRSLLNQKVHSLQDPEDGNDTDDTKCRCPQCNGKLILYKFKEVFKPDFHLNSS